ncbi:MAG: hypothetical protein M1820_008371 [Bogoriella megaspora]|nr:MAG: hypothetical protein M1820_008371 [Bogoriella megaspora]
MTGFSTRISLSQANLLWAVQVSINLAYGRSGFSISPDLQAQRVIGWPEARKELCELFESGKASTHDIDPSGQTWIEKILSRPWSVPVREAQFGLLHFFMQNGAKFDTENPLLSLCMSWIGEGPHLYLLKKLFDYGYNTSQANTQYRVRWPEACNPNWFSEPFAEDPFFLDVMKECVKSDPGFGDNTPFLEHVLSGSQNDVAKNLVPSSLQERNFLGHSALHLTVQRPATLSLLLSSSKDVDVHDQQRTTPLMYAAAYGFTDSVIMLLEAGADPFAEDDLRHRTFWEYAAVRDHWDLIITVAGWFQSRSAKEDSQSLVNSLMEVYLFYRYATIESRFKDLLNLGVDPNLVTERGTLLHQIYELDEIEALFNAGFAVVNSTDENGISALMDQMSRERLFALSVKLCLDRGANLGQKDNQGWTALHHALTKLAGDVLQKTKEDLDLQLERINTIKLLISYGADPVARDYCLCACSSSGCTPAAVLSSPNWFSRYGLFWSIEYLMILIDLGQSAAAETAVLGYIRAKEFQNSELTHVCCKRYRFSKIEEEDIEEILDEERLYIQGIEMSHAELSRANLDRLQEIWIEQLASRTSNDGIILIARRQAARDTIPSQNQQNEAVPKPESRRPLREFIVDRKHDILYVQTNTSWNMLHWSDVYLEDYREWLELAFKPQNPSAEMSSSNMEGYQRRLAFINRLEQAIAVQNA